MDANQAESMSRLDAKIDASQEKMDIHQAQTLIAQAEMKAKMDCHHEKLMTIMKASKEKTEAMSEVCL
jgi:hypothetical protein